jgi:hypothetical protein
MSQSGMNSREKAVVAVLGVIIVVALIGIGVLVAKLVTGGGADGQTTGITPATTTPVGAAASAESPTLVANPSLEEGGATPAPGGAEPVAVVQVESSGPLFPATLTSQALHPGRSYRIEITAVDGSETAIRGSWSQSAKSADGKLELPLPEMIEGTTPFLLDLAPPMVNPSSWSVSVSASPRELLGQPPRLTITVWDVTGQ